MVDSPSENEGRRVSLAVTIGGKPAPTDAIASVEVVHSVNRIPRARIVLFDGNPADRRFPLMDGGQFDHGQPVVISAGYDGSLKALFKGVVVKVGLEVRPGSAAKLVVEAADKALKLTRSRSAVVSPGATLESIAQAIFEAAGGISPGSIIATKTQEAMVQLYASDWDLLVVLAEAAGAVVVVEDGKVNIVAPDSSKTASLLLSYGSSVVEAEIKSDATYQYLASAAPFRAWDAQSQQVVEARAQGGASMPAPGKSTTEKLAGVLGVKSIPRQSGAALTTDQLGELADGAYARAQLARVQGRVSYQGSDKAGVGSVVELADFGRGLSGSAYVSGTSHVFTRNLWQTTAELGLSPHRFSEELGGDGGLGDTALQVAPAAGLQIGQVKKIVTDAKGQHRVFVIFPTFKDTNAEHGVWARLASFYASKDIGAIFFPEVDDEVIVGFIGADPRGAVILGGLYSGARPPKYPADQPNTSKAIVTRSKLEISFNDKDIVLDITTPGGRQLTLSDKSDAESIQLKDKGGNSLTMDKTGIAIKTDKDFSVTAKGAITLSASKDFSASSGAAASFTGKTVQVSGSDALTAESSGGQATLKGATVTIKGGKVAIN